eukprot:CAMPEP_0202062168 /NCGR_PEP_ID=MMETSP0963-20130614/43211_1 /ASSEMBLY_ACC=CAM_ASM_000494 /TAXON_ID=4773 /ORGANISM="Schizochytrium aggregatum, Strain ATCC28209" /LENGTH=47 /DNA_ID= /DNA_START= /DNA_END= /DNA_ORIENTATION=
MAAVGQGGAKADRLSGVQVKACRTFARKMLELQSHDMTAASPLEVVA